MNKVNNFMRYTQVVNWAESLAKKNNGKVAVTMVDCDNHRTLSSTELNNYLYKKGIPDYQRRFNLSYDNGKKTVFNLAVKGFSVIIICEFMYPQKGSTLTFTEQEDGQLSMVELFEEQDGQLSLFERAI